MTHHQTAVSMGEGDGRETLALYAGVFDPPTSAHVEVIETALRIFDRMVVVVAVNPSKGAPMFTAEERVHLLEASIQPSSRTRVQVMSYDRLIAPLAERLGATALVRAMRPVTDPDYEIALSLMNAKLAPSIPTVLLVAKADHVYLSSTFVRDTAVLEGLIVPGSVPAPVAEALQARFPRAERKQRTGVSIEAEAEPSTTVIMRNDQ